MCPYLFHGILAVEGRDANHPVLDESGQDLRLLWCRAGVHMGISAHEVSQFGGGMQPLEH